MITERSHGGSSLANGQLEIMMHRNPEMGDGFGKSRAKPRKGGKKKGGKLRREKPGKGKEKKGGKLRVGIQEQKNERRELKGGRCKETPKCVSEFGISRAFPGKKTGKIERSGRCSKTPKGVSRAYPWGRG